MRRALFWTLDEAFAPPSELRAFGWNIDPVGFPLDVRPGGSEQRYRVGLLAFRPKETSWPMIQDAVLATRPLEWIALIPPHSIADAKVKKAIGETFFDYHTMPIHASVLAACLGHASGMAELRQSCDVGPNDRLGEFSMIGRSQRMCQVYEAIQRIAPTDVPVLIRGETGTGKELAARAIHDASPRRDAPFVPVNCAALPETLIQAELFGYEKGAFTDAKARHIGRIEAAAGGTLFLDEIGDLPTSVQAVLLRFLQEKVIERLGGTRLIPLDVRIVAATHLDLEQRIRTDRFRDDLYYRLNVLRLDVPPLREREGDVTLLANSMLHQFAGRTNKRIRGFSVGALERMNSYEWPGNVRELINRVHRAAVMCEGRLISASDLDLAPRASSRSANRLASSRQQAEQQALRDALARFRTLTRASAELGISRMTLYRLMAKYGMTRDSEPQ